MKRHLFILTVLLMIPFAGMCKFIRVYDKSGNLIAKGIYKNVNDTAIEVLQKGSAVFVNAEKIGVVTLGHHVGHNILIGAAVGGFLMTIAGIISAAPDDPSGHTAGEGAAMGLLLGSVAGAAIGAATTETSWNRFHIYGSMEELKKFQLTMKNYL